LNASTPNLHDQAHTPTRAKLWRGRVWLGIRVFFFIWVGMMLLVAPWLPVWTRNSLTSANITLHDLLNSGFVRGAVSGLGLINLWIGIADAVNYRE
jgi:hypothetical protein